MKKTWHGSEFIVISANRDGTMDIDYESLKIVQIEALPHVDECGNLVFLAEIVKKGSEQCLH